MKSATQSYLYEVQRQNHRSMTRLDSDYSYLVDPSRKCPHKREGKGLKLRTDPHQKDVGTPKPKRINQPIQNMTPFPKQPLFGPAPLEPEIIELRASIASLTRENEIFQEQHVRDTAIICHQNELISELQLCTGQQKQSHTWSKPYQLELVREQCILMKTEISKLMKQNQQLKWQLEKCSKSKSVFTSTVPASKKKFSEVDEMLAPTLNKETSWQPVGNQFGTVSQAIEKESNSNAVNTLWEIMQKFRFREIQLLETSVFSWSRSVRRFE